VNTVARYLVHEFLKMFVFSLACFVAVYIVVDFFERVDNFLEAGVSLWLMAKYILLKIPIMIQQLLAAALLMATTITVCIMAKNREIIIFRTSGISLSRLFLPFLLVSICFSFVLFFLTELVIPEVSKETNHIYRIQVQKRPMNTLYRNERFWYRGKDVIYHITLYDPTTKTLNGVTMYRFGEPFGLLERVDAEKARWTGTQWQFIQGLRQELLPGKEIRSEKFDLLILPITETPSDFSHIYRNPEEMTRAELKQYIEKLQREGYDPGSYRVDLHAKTAYPLVCVILVMLGFPLAVRRRGGAAVAAAVGFSIGAAFVYYVLFSLFLSLGHSGMLPPWPAAWLTNVLFLATGAAAFLYTPQ